jgi:SAM-dependent methyltransferase
MHDTAFAIGAKFFELYCPPRPCTIVEIGSQDFNGSLRKKAPPGASYLGLDLEAGPGVDAVIAHGAPLPLATASVDLVVASSVFEHDPRFWESFLELCRITKDGGFIYLNVPSNGKHRRHAPFGVGRSSPDRTRGDRPGNGTIRHSRRGFREAHGISENEASVETGRSPYGIVFRRGRKCSREFARPFRAPISDRERGFVHKRVWFQRRNEVTL